MQVKEIMPKIDMLEEYAAMTLISTRSKIARKACDWKTAISLGMICLLSSTLLHAGDVYKYLDAQGNVTYSATPPPIPLSFEVIHISDEPESAGDHAASIDEIRDMAEQLEKDRKQREEARAAARQAQEQEGEARETTEPPGQIYFYPVYPPAFRHRHGSTPSHPHHRPRRPPSWHVPLRYPTPEPHK